jgi:hypothetical protein
MKFHKQAADKLQKLKRNPLGVLYTSTPFFIAACWTEFEALLCIDLIASGNANDEIDIALCFRQNQIKKVKFKLNTDIAAWVQTDDSVIY